MVSNLVYKLEVLSDLRNAVSELYASTEPETRERFYTATVLLDKLEQMVIEEFKEDYESDKEA